MRTDSFDYFLPDELVAQSPLQERDQCRLMVLHKNGEIHHRNFHDIVDYLTEGDLLILNNTKVIPARLTGYKKSGVPLDILMVKEIRDNEWEILSKGRYSGPLKITDNLSVHVNDGRHAVFPSDVHINGLLWELGLMPLPPYIRRKATGNDRQWYQTVYAEKEGSIAAPTAGLHFTDTVLRRAEDIGVKVRRITLHVSAGTFKPIRTDTLEEHTMDNEYYELRSSLIDEIAGNRKHGKKVVAVGTTSTRAIEGHMSNNHMSSRTNGFVSGTTEIFIYPGYEFNAIDGLLTNFHLPRSTPLMLASAVAGRENLLKSYDEAIEMKYRFFSYGDAMLIL
jgi:S-adenosylmethionine:tRNA ribosyltransferase-isomerase